MQRRTWQPPGGAASHRHRPALPGRGDVAGQEALEQNEPGAGAGGEHSPAVAVLEVGAGAAVDGGEESKKRSERHMGSEWQWKFAEGAGSGGSSGGPRAVGRVDQHAAIGMATERGATTRLKDSPPSSPSPVDDFGSSLRGPKEMVKPRSSPPASYLFSRGAGSE